jgi:FkbM family methyltransferase
MVIAVEPDPWLVYLLNRSAALRQQGEASTTVVSAAVSEKNGLAEFNIAKRGRASNFISGFGNSETGGYRSRQSVLTISLDWLLDWFPPPNVLKIDVEGMEAKAFAGAKNLLTFRPTLWCEVARQNEQMVTQLLREHGYCFRYEHGNSLEMAQNNVIAVPASVGISGA